MVEEQSLKSSHNQLADCASANMKTFKAYSQFNKSLITYDLIKV